MNINLTDIINAVLALLAALVTYKLVPWIQSKTTAKQQENLEFAVNMLVYAAEKRLGSGNGKEKLEYVKHGLEERGFTIDRDAIEAACQKLDLDMKNLKIVDDRCKVYEFTATDE